MILLIIEIFSVQHTVFLERTSLVAQTVKRLSTMRETQVQPWVGKIPWRRKWQSTPILLLGKSHGQRSLVGYSPWGCKESDTTERLHFTLECIYGYGYTVHCTVYIVYICLCIHGIHIYLYMYIVKT